MRNALILLSASGMLMFVSCKRENTSPDPDPTPATPQIVHHDLTPDSIIQSCDSLMPWSSYYIPVPQDTTFYYNYDLNSDSIIDLRFAATNYYQFYSNTSPEVNYQRNLNVNSPDSTIEFSSQNGPPLLTLYDSAQVVNSSSLWEFGNFAYYRHTSYPFGQTFNGDEYLLFRMKVGANLYKYGWLHLIGFDYPDGYRFYLLDWAINNTVNQQIAAGQL
jgi:hypothetical protein